MKENLAIAVLHSFMCLNDNLNRNLKDSTVEKRNTTGGSASDVLMNVFITGPDIRSLEEQITFTKIKISYHLHSIINHRFLNVVDHYHGKCMTMDIIE